jgi:hypothetical protein
MFLEIFLWTLDFTSTCISTVPKSFGIHLRYHVQYTISSFNFTLWQSAYCDTLAETNSIAEEFLQDATQAPQPIQVAASISIVFRIGIAFASVGF